MKALIGVGDAVLIRPAGCICPDGDWCCNPPDACDHFEPEYDDQPAGKCLHCEHDKGCHS